MIIEPLMLPTIDYLKLILYSEEKWTWKDHFIIKMKILVLVDLLIVCLL